MRKSANLVICLFFFMCLAAYFGSGKKWSSASGESWFPLEQGKNTFLPSYDHPAHHSVAIFNGTLEAFLNNAQRAKFDRYTLFETRTNGAAQPARGWYQDNAEPSYTCLFEERLGPKGEGGKWVCDPSSLLYTTECLVYSVGSNNDFHFEEAVLQVARNCQIHVFDHTVKNPSKKPRHVHFHPWGLASVTDPTTNLKSLADIVAQLGHAGKKINILKIDCEGCEWTTFETWHDADVVIDEILLEVHGGTTAPRDNPVAKQLMQNLAAHDYRIFHKEPNIQFAAVGDDLCFEYGFKRVSMDAYF